jgi:hypothetical protein
MESMDGMWVTCMGITGSTDCFVDPVHHLSTGTSPYRITSNSGCAIVSVFLITRLSEFAMEWILADLHRERWKGPGCGKMIFCRRGLL